MKMLYNTHTHKLIWNKKNHREWIKFIGILLTHRNYGKNYFELSVHRLEKSLNKRARYTDTGTGPTDNTTSNNKLRRKLFSVCYKRCRYNHQPTPKSTLHRRRFFLITCLKLMYKDYSQTNRLKWAFRLRNIQVNVETFKPPSNSNCFNHSMVIEECHLIKGIF